MATDPIDAYYRQLEQQSQADLERRVAAERAWAERLAQQMQPIAGEVEGIATRGADASSAYARGFSDTMAQLANQSTQGANEYLTQMGQPAGMPEVGGSAANAMYGSYGYIPAVGLRNYGAAQAGAAAMMPGTVRMQAEQGIAGMRQQYEESIRDLRNKRTEYNLFERPKLEAERREDKRREAMQLYEAGLLTQRQFARQMGVKNWRKFPNTPPGAGPAKVNTSLSKELGYLVDDYGNAIRDRKGKPVYMPQEAPDPEIRSQGGYIWERGADGKWVPVGGTGPAPRAPRAPKGYQLKTLKDGSTAVFDPNTGQTRVIAPPPKGSRGPKMTTKQRADYRAAALAFAENALRGIRADAEDVKEGRAKAVGELLGPPLGLADALEELKKEPIPWGFAKNIVLSYYKRNFVGPIPGIGAKDTPGRDRKNVSYEGPSSLAPGLHNLFGYALGQGFTNLGTHNPASRLPGGGVSDHAVWPARAFDIGGFSGGYGNAKARKMFQWLTKQPGVEYVILGDKIWSRRNGLRPYTHGGHETHIHVSGAADGQV